MDERARFRQAVEGFLLAVRVDGAAKDKALRARTCGERVEHMRVDAELELVRGAREHVQEAGEARARVRVDVHSHPLGLTEQLVGHEEVVGHGALLGRADRIDKALELGIDVLVHAVVVGNRHVPRGVAVPGPARGTAQEAGARACVVRLVRPAVAGHVGVAIGVADGTAGHTGARAAAGGGHLSGPVRRRVGHAAERVHDAAAFLFEVLDDARGIASRHAAALDAGFRGDARVSRAGGVVVGVGAIAVVRAAGARIAVVRTAGAHLLEIEQALVGGVHARRDCGEARRHGRLDGGEHSGDVSAAGAAVTAATDGGRIDVGVRHSVAAVAATPWRGISCCRRGSSRARRHQCNTGSRATGSTREAVLWCVVPKGPSVTIARPTGVGSARTLEGQRAARVTPARGCHEKA